MTQFLFLVSREASAESRKCLDSSRLSGQDLQVRWWPWWKQQQSSCLLLWRQAVVCAASQPQQMPTIRALCSAEELPQFSSMGSLLRIFA